jgi:hypothetical protein
MTEELSKSEPRRADCSYSGHGDNGLSCGSLTRELVVACAKLSG